MTEPVAPTVADALPPLGNMLKLPDVMDLKAATPLMASLLAMRGSDVLIDACDVLRLGGQCLQVLMSAQLTWSADSAAIEIINPSSDFLDGLALFGVDPDQFGKPNHQESSL